MKEEDFPKVIEKIFNVVENQEKTCDLIELNMPLNWEENEMIKIDYQWLFVYCNLCDLYLLLSSFKNNSKKQKNPLEFVYKNQYFAYYSNLENRR